MAKVVIYSSNMCGFCHRAKALLQSKGVEYEERVVDMNPQLRAEMRAKSGGATSVPQIWIDGEHIGGSDDLYALEQNGALDLLLGAA